MFKVMKLFLIFVMFSVSVHAAVTILPDKWKALAKTIKPGLGSKVDVAVFNKLFSEIVKEIPGQLTDFVNQTDDSGYTLLIKSAFKGTPDIVTQLLDVKGINLDAQVTRGTIIGQTALIIAAFWGRDDMVAKLCEKEANLNMQDNNGNTALIQVLISGNAFPEQSLNIVKTLLKNNADVNIKNKNGLTALTMAINADIDGNMIPIIQELLKVKNIKINEQLGEGILKQTVLQMAIAKRNAKVVQLLLENDADPNLEVEVVPGNPIAGKTTPYQSAKNKAAAFKIIKRDKEEKEMLEVLKVIDEFEKVKKAKASGSAGASASAGAEADEEARRKAEEDRRAREEEERLKAEAKKAEDKKRAEAEAEAKRKADEDTKRAEDDAKNKAAEEEARRKAAEAKKAEEDARKAREEEERKAAEAKKRAEEEARRKAEEAKASASAGAKDTGIEKLIDALDKLKKLLGDLKDALGKIK